MAAFAGAAWLGLPSLAEGATRVSVGELPVDRQARAESLRALTPPSTQRQLQSWLDSLAHLPPADEASLARRVAMVSERCLGAAYSWNPTGEGRGHLDADPPLVLDRFDCMTLVETVMAVARARTVPEVFHHLAALRYGSQAARFENRTHFVSTQWWPTAVDEAQMADLLATTGAVPQRGLRIVEVQVDEARWVHSLHKHPMYRRVLAQAGAAERDSLARWAQRAESQPAAPRQLRLWMPDAVLAASSHQPPWQSGDLWAIARPAAHLTQTAGGGDPIAHVGFVLQRDRTWVLRSASLQERAVSDVPISAALRSTPRQGEVLGVAMGRLRPIGP